MVVKVEEVRKLNFHVELSEQDVRYLLEHHGQGSVHRLTNHAFCSETTCVICKLVRELKELLKAHK